MLLDADLRVFEERDYFLIEFCTPKALEAGLQEPAFVEQVLTVYLATRRAERPRNPLRTTQLGGLWSERPSTGSWSPTPQDETRPDTDEYAQLHPSKLGKLHHTD